MNLRKFLPNKKADMNLILSAIVIAIVLAVSVLIVYNIIGTVDTSEIDSDFSGTPALNSTTNLLDNTNTFYSIAPILLIIVSAVAILSYVMLLRRT